MGRRAGQARMEPTEAVHLRRLLRLGSERRHEEAEGEGEHEPEGPEPPGGVLLKYTCVLTPALIQERSGGGPEKKRLTASTSTV
jgi:hypothetical protein